MTPPARARPRLTRPRALAMGSAAAVLLACGVVLAGCGTMTMEPPSLMHEGVDDGVDVTITDYGLHAGLVLPREVTSTQRMPMGEYAFGEWEWFALGRTGVLRVPGALWSPSDGALMRHDIPDDERLRDHLAWEGLDSTITLCVSRERALALSRRLDDAIDAPGVERVERAGSLFARTSTQYSAGHNCNHELALWMEELGVLVTGSRRHARFRVAQPAP